MDYSLKLLDVLDGSGILEVVDNTHAETDAEFLGGALQNAWVADHVFELNMLSLFFARNAGTRSGVNYDAIWNNLEQVRLPDKPAFPKQRLIQRNSAMYSTPVLHMP